MFLHCTARFGSVSVCSVGIQQFNLESEILLSSIWSVRFFYSGISNGLVNHLVNSFINRLGNDAVIYIVNSLLNHRVNRLENDVIISCISLRTVMWR